MECPIGHASIALDPLDAPDPLGALDTLGALDPPDHLGPLDTLDPLRVRWRYADPAGPAELSGDGAILAQSVATMKSYRRQAIV